MKKLLSVLGLAPFFAFAEGGAGSVADALPADIQATTELMNQTLLKTSAQAVGNNMLQFLTNITPFVIGVAAAFIGLSLIWVVVRWFRRAGK